MLFFLSRLFISKIKIRRVKFYSSLTLISLLSGLDNLGHALESDRHATLQITADSAELDEKKGVAIYKGDVELTQGSLKILSKSLSIKQNETGVQKVIASGNPARYQQQLENEEQPVQANAKSIVYLVDQQKIRLTGDALLKQGGSRFEGEKIEYDIRKKILSAASDTKKSPNKKTTSRRDKRVKMVLPPAKPTIEEPEEKDQSNEKTGAE